MRKPTEIELRVAKALCAARGHNPESVIKDSIQSLTTKVGGRKAVEISYPAWQPYITLAIAAIRAMREPTQEMISEACDDERLKREDWQTMIDAASPK